MLVKIVTEYQNGLVTGIQNQLSGTTGGSLKILKVMWSLLLEQNHYSQFDFLAPGMMVFAILLLSTTVAASLTREVEKGTLARLKLSKMRSFDMLFGGLLPWSSIAALQVLILLGAAIIIGFHWQGGINSIFLAMIVAIIGGVASVALGMIIASFAQNDRQATNLGTISNGTYIFLVRCFFPASTSGNW